MNTKTLDNEDAIKRVFAWFQNGTPYPEDRDAHARFSDVLLHMQNLISVLQEAGSHIEHRKELASLSQALFFAQRQFQFNAANGYVSFDDLDRALILRLISKMIVALVGTAQSLEMDVEGALQAFADSNQSTQPAPALAVPALGLVRGSGEEPDYAKYV